MKRQLFFSESCDRSFIVGVDAWELPYKVETKEEQDRFVARYDFGNGLVITNEAKKYERFGAYEWVNYIENTSNSPTEIISDLFDCDVKLDFPYEENRKNTA